MPAFTNELRALAASLGVSDHLHFLPLAPPDQMETLAAAYDLGLCAELGHTRNRQVALSNKQFTYLLAGIPALMSDIPPHRAFQAEAKEAVELFAMNDERSLSRAMDRVLSDPEKLAAMRRTAWQLGQDRFHWEHEAVRLVELVRDSIGYSRNRVPHVESSR